MARNEAHTPPEPRFRIVPATEGHRLVPADTARMLEFHEVSAAFTFGHRGREYFALKTGRLYRIAAEGERVDALFPHRSVGRPKEGVPLKEVAIVDADLLTIDQMAMARRELEAFEASTTT